MTPVLSPLLLPGEYEPQIRFLNGSSSSHQMCFELYNKYMLSEEELGFVQRKLHVGQQVPEMFSNNATSKFHKLSSYLAHGIVAC